MAGRTVPRLALVGLGVVLLALASFAVVNAAHTQRAAARASHATALAETLADARYDVGAEESLERKYRLEPSPEVLARHTAAGRDLVARLNRVARIAPAEQSFVRRVLDLHARYLVATHGMFRAVDAKDASLVLHFDGHVVDPVFGAMEEAVDRAAIRSRQQARGTLSALRGSERFVVRATPVGFALGLVLLALCMGILLGYQRRLDHARRRELGQLERVALTDSLTDLRNHRAFHEDIGRELQRVSRSGRPMSLVMLDLDGLKAVNDTLGHQAGDDQLKALANALRSTLRGGDAAYRLGGDEFAALLAGEEAWRALAFVQRLQHHLKITTEGRVSATAGIADTKALLPRDELIRRADLALIDAKRGHLAARLWGDELGPLRVAGDDRAAEQHNRALAAALARAVDAKDSYTRSHSQTVAEIAAIIAAELGLDPERRRRVHLSGLLHDVGKIGVSESILQKPGKLTLEESEVMKTHSRLGYDIVAAADLHEEARWILHHHERIDGAGYPAGLAGEAIPLESRILAVADTFEAITSDRPYRRAQSEQVAIAELDRCAGTQLDSDCVAALKCGLAHGQHPAPVVH